MTGIDLSEGAVFAEQFQVVRPLARGGMGAVYVVKQLGTGRERALKLMHPMLIAEERSLERFEREAQVGSQIESDHVVEVIAAGIDRTSSTPWLCMELLKGETLAERIARAGALSRDEAIAAFEQLGHALSAAHRAGIVHRDLKPENLFLATPRRQGVAFTLKVLDFGVAALVKESASSKTTQGVGSPMWMAPEQTDHGKVSRVTDIWALGLIAYNALTGVLYWRTPSKAGASLTALLVEIMVEPLAAASERAREQGVADRLPPGFDGWFERCVDRDPSRRYSDVAEAIATLVGLLSGKAAIIPATRTSVPQAFEETAASTGPLVLSGASAPRQVPSAAQPESRIETQVVPRKRSPLMTAVLGLVAAMALVGLGALLVSAFQTPEVVHPVASSAPAPPQQVSQVMQPIPTPVVSPAPAVSLAQAGPEPATGAAGIEPAVPAEQAPIEAGSVPSGQAEQGTAPRQDTADGSSELAEEPREERRRDTASSRRASRPAARGPRLQPHEALFVSSIVRACAEGNPRPTQPIPVTLVLELGQFNNVRGMRVTGLDDYAALRRCIVMRGTSFRFTETPPEIPVSFTTMIGPD